MFYSKSIALDSTSSVVYANRALAHLREKNFEQAEEDCTMALELDPTYLNRSVSVAQGVTTIWLPLLNETTGAAYDEVGVAEGGECRPSAPMTRHRRKAPTPGTVRHRMRVAPPKAAGACTAHSAARCHRSNGVEAGP